MTDRFPLMSYIGEQSIARMQAQMNLQYQLSILCGWWYDGDGVVCILKWTGY